MLGPLKPVSQHNIALCFLFACLSWFPFHLTFLSFARSSHSLPKSNKRRPTSCLTCCFPTVVTHSFRDQLPMTHAVAFSVVSRRQSASADFNAALDSPAQPPEVVLVLRVEGRRAQPADAALQARAGLSVGVGGDGGAGGDVNDSGGRHWQHVLNTSVRVDLWRRWPQLQFLSGLQRRDFGACCGFWVRSIQSGECIQSWEVEYPFSLMHLVTSGFPFGCTYTATHDSLHLSLAQSMSCISSRQPTMWRCSSPTSSAFPKQTSRVPTASTSVCSKGIVHTAASLIRSSVCVV